MGRTDEEKVDGCLAWVAGLALVLLGLVALIAAWSSNDDKWLGGAIMLGGGLSLLYYHGGKAFRTPEEIARDNEKQRQEAEEQRQRRELEESQRREEEARRSENKDRESAVAAVEAFYAEHAELLAPHFPRPRLQAELRVRIPPDTQPSAAWTAARDLMVELQGVLQGERKRTAFARVPVNPPPGSGPPLSNI